MKKSHNIFTEHYLVPAVLFLLNICLAQLIYAFVGAPTYPLVGKIALAVAFVSLGGSLVFKRQVLLMGSMMLYAMVVVWG